MNPIYATNTTDAGLKNTQITSAAVAIMSHRLKGLAACTTFFEGNAQASGGMAYVVPVLSTSGSRLTNPTSMQSGDVTMVASALAGAHIARSGHISNAERGLGLSRAHLVPTLVNKYVDDLIELATAVITAANFGASLGTVTAANFDETTVETLVAGVAGQPRCILTTAPAIHGIRANLFREGGMWITPNIEGGVWEMTLAAATNNPSAVIATPEAIAGVIALPPGLKLQMGEDLSITPLDIEGLGTLGWITTWVDRATRAEWVAVESVCAFGVGQSTALRFVASSPHQNQIKVSTIASWRGQGGPQHHVSAGAPLPPIGIRMIELLPTQNLILASDTIGPKTVSNDENHDKAKAQKPLIGQWYSNCDKN